MLTSKPSQTCIDTAHSKHISVSPKLLYMLHLKLQQCISIAKMREQHVSTTLEKMALV